MKIVALDTYVTDYDGMDYSVFEQLGEFIRYPRSVESDILERAQGADALITNKIKFDAQRMNQLSALKYIGIFATGTNNVDLQAAAQRNIAVANVPAYSTDSVAQQVIAFILNYSTNVASYDNAVKEGRWATSSDFCFYEKPIFEAAGKSLGIVGAGAIGSKVAKIATAIGMQVMYAALPGRSYQDHRVSLVEILSNCDFVSLHCPLTPGTKNMLDREMLKRFKKSAVLINTARGALVDEQALYEALEKRELAHACLDVFSEEPPAKENLLQFSKYTTITPHVAWGAREARVRLINEAALNLKAFINGEHRNRVELRDSR